MNTAGHENLVIYVKVLTLLSLMVKLFFQCLRRKGLFYKTFGNIADEVYIEKIVPQWAETQEDKQNNLEYTGMYDQKTVRYKKYAHYFYVLAHKS